MIGITHSGEPWSGDLGEMACRRCRKPITRLAKHQKYCRACAADLVRERASARGKRIREIARKNKRQ